jgi:hypothetical protein
VLIRLSLRNSMHPDARKFMLLLCLEIIECLFKNKALLAICSLVTLPVTFATLKKSVFCHERPSATALLVQSNIFGSLLRQLV